MVYLAIPLETVHLVPGIYGLPVLLVHKIFHTNSRKFSPKNVCDKNRLQLWMGRAPSGKKKTKKNTKVHRITESESYNLKTIKYN